MNRNFVLFFTIKEFENVHLYKDVGLVPCYLCKEYNLNGKIIYSNEVKKELPKQFRNLELEEIKFIKFPNIIRKLDKFKLLENISFYKYLLKNAKKIDYLMFFHYSVDKIFLIQLYKFLNPKGKIYIKLDSSGNYKEKGLKTMVSKFLLKKYEKKVDLFSIETIDAMEKLKIKNLFGIQNFEKLIYIPNGFDENYLIENKIIVKTYEEKENIIITVGRIGAPEKNNELLLKALEKIDLQEWKVLLIGPYTENFKELYDDFIKKNQNKRDKVLLVGNIKSKDKLYEYYNKAKSFILTSNRESFGIVLVEALRFGDYIIATDVGATRDITENGKIGSIIEIDNLMQLQSRLEEVIAKKINLEKKYKDSLNLSNKSFLWSKIIKNKFLKKIFDED